LARSIDEIKQEIITEYNKIPELAEANSTSKTAIWNLLIYVVAVAHYIHESLFDFFKKEVNDIIDRNNPGSPSWYAERVLDFQINDKVEVVDGKVTYPILDPAKQIIKRVSYKEAGGTLTLKVAKETGALSPEEKVQVESYIERYKFAGSDVSLVSLNADKLRVYGTVFYDGIYSAATVKESVKLAIQSYINNLDFDGIIYKTKLVDAIQAAQGVIDIDVSKLEGIQGTIVEQITRKYETAAGYINLEDATGYTLNDTLNFVVES
jgi:hypothetical protein